MINAKVKKVRHDGLLAIRKKAPGAAPMERLNEFLVAPEMGVTRCGEMFLSKLKAVM